MDSQEAVILVVGVNEQYKTRVAEALADRRGAADVETTKGGARIFRRKWSTEARFVQTTPLVRNAGFDSISEDSRVWVSMNSLRELSGKHIYVVCVLASSGPDDSVHQQADVFNDKYNWLNMLGFIFKENQKAIMLLVKLEGEDKSETKKSAVKDLLQRDGFARGNISFQTFEKEDLVPTVEAALEHSLYRGKGVGNAKDSKDTLKPFLLKEVCSNAKVLDMYGPWGPERAILFGRTGSGKSTLAQMLTRGKLDAVSEVFASSSSIRGETKELQHGQGRGWYVVDTPGFGEPADEHSTVSIGEAEKKIKKYVQLIDGKYSHFIYVVAKDRIDQLETNLWQFFVLLFGKDRKPYFSVVISNGNKSWVEENEAHLRTSFEGCTSFLSAEFPAIKKDDSEWEEELHEVRTASLKELEEELSILKRDFAACDYGMASKGNLKIAMAQTTLNAREMKHMTQRAITSVLMGAAKTYYDFRRLTLALTRDDKVLLLPTL